jgi:hypothetical protein
VIEWDMSEVRDLADDLGDAGARVTERSQVVMEKTGHDVVSDAQALCPVRTGNLKNSIGVDFGNLSFEVKASASYAAIVEYGSAPHTIRPRTKQALFWPGATHPVKQVQHPGTAPQPFLIPAFDRNLPAAYQAFERVAADIL